MYIDLETKNSYNMFNSVNEFLECVKNNDIVLCVKNIEIYNEDDNFNIDIECYNGMSFSINS